MNDGTDAASALRLARAVEAVGATLAVTLALLRPLLWSGEPTDLPNLLHLALAATLGACGLLHRGVAGIGCATSRPALLGGAFLALAAIGCWRSPYPADAWATWCSWTVQLGAATAAAPIIVRHRQWVIAGLIAGLAGECLLIGAQVAWERPDLARRLVDDPALVEDRLRALVDERIANWRLEGTFLLANTLAAYLLLVLPWAWGLAWAAWRARRPATWWLTALAAAGTAALAVSGSKAGILAALVAASLTAIATGGRRTRAVVFAACLAVVAVALSVSAVRARAIASADARLGYWSAGAALVGERPLTGHGIDGFRLHYPRLKAPEAEETIIAHNEPLQAAIDLGVPAAALLIAWWIVGLRRLATAPAVAPADGVAIRRWAMVAAVGAVAAYVVVAVGALVDRVDAWPGGAWWLVPMSLIALAIVAQAPRLPPAPAWCGFAAVAGCLAHACADFHLHSAQVVGVLGLVVVVAGVSPSADRAPHGTRSPMPWACAAIALLTLTAAGVGWSAWRGQERDRAQLTANALARLTDESGVDERAIETLLAAQAAYDLPPATAPLDLARRAVDALIATATTWPDDPAAAAQALTIIRHANQAAPDGADSWEPLLERLVARWPEHLGFRASLAAHLSRRARDDHALHPVALAQWREVVARYPTHLPFRAALGDIARIAGDTATAEAQEREIQRLAPLVHASNRLPDRR
ncbi:MAG TPA: O-antigen ligase family protein [Planctomycetota bacterium]|nr:O-antigen ligase family protein [Planctomycetota bacterium]